MSSTETIDARLAERLRRANLVSDEQLESARLMQKEEPLPLAEALVRLDILSKQEASKIISSLQDVRFVRLEDLQIDREAVRHIPGHLARAHRCIPIRRTGNLLAVAASDPTATGLAEALASVTDFETLVLAAEPDAVEHALYVHYSDDAGTRRLSGNATEYRHSTVNRQPWSLCSPWPQSFDSFIDHDAARGARELAKQVAAESQEPINYPILLIGDNGSGKSHLLEAIRSYRVTHDPMSRGLLCTGAELVSQYWEYRVSGQLNALRFELRDYECVLVDDCFDLFGDSSVESELSELIRHSQSVGSQLVLTLTPEQHLSGPRSSELRGLLAKGTEVTVAAPNGKALQELVTTRIGTSTSVNVVGAVIPAAVENGWYGIVELNKQNARATTNEH